MPLVVTPGSVRGQIAWDFWPLAHSDPVALRKGWSITLQLSGITLAAGARETARRFFLG